MCYPLYSKAMMHLVLYEQTYSVSRMSKNCGLKNSNKLLCTIRLTKCSSEIALIRGSVSLVSGNFTESVIWMLLYDLHKV